MKIRKGLHFIILVSTLYLGISIQGFSQELTSEFVLEQAMKFHDPDSKWNQTTLSIHIQEPRIQNPGRFSKLTLNTSSGGFSLSRDYEIGEVKRIISHNGETTVLLNGSANYSNKIKDEYRLDSSRNAGYKRFYQILMGFPMSMKGDLIKGVSHPIMEDVFGTEYLMLDFSLSASIISDRWQVYFSKEDYSVRALKFIHEEPDEEDEVILFDGIYTWDGISIPRYRHWYSSETREYLGSDIIVKELE